MIRIILTEDQNIVRNGIKSLLSHETDIEVVTDVKDGIELLALLKQGIEADILITSINLPFVSKNNLLGHVHVLYPSLKIIILSALDDDHTVAEAFKAGAAGYVLKSVGAEEFLFIVQQVGHSNKRYLCNELTVRMLDKLIVRSEGTFVGDAGQLGITRREVEVLTLIARGLINQEVADQLFSSKRTIENHRQHLIEKTGSRNTAALIRYALINKIIE